MHPFSSAFFSSSNLSSGAEKSEIEFLSSPVHQLYPLTVTLMYTVYAYKLVRDVNLANFVNEYRFAEIKMLTFLGACNVATALVLYVSYYVLLLLCYSIAFMWLLCTLTL